MTPTNPSGAAVDVLAWIGEQVRFLAGGHPNSIRAQNRARGEQVKNAVTALLTRNAELEAEREALRSAPVDAREIKDKRVEVSVLSSNGKPCLSVGGLVVSGPWTGRGSTTAEFKIPLGDLIEAIAEEGRPRMSRTALVSEILSAFARAEAGSHA